MDLAQFDYYLPPELIAQQPCAQRDQSRLLVVNRNRQTWRHCQAFAEINELLHPGDMLVLNNTKVVPARLFGKRSTGGKVEILVIQQQGALAQAMIKSRRPPKIAEKYTFGDYRAQVVEKTEQGWLLDFQDAEVTSVMQAIGSPPLPPYIKRKDTTSAMRTQDRQRYQTVYASCPGAIAAPTAGLHFTQNLLEQIQQRGVAVEYITLHVGPGTFLPIRSHNVREHIMGKERYHVSAQTASKINRALAEQRRIIAVGTTSCRTLETAGSDGQIISGEGVSSLYIYPGYSFRIISGLITNFHLPKSTLLLLVAALLGTEFVKTVYREAVEQRYRFYSYGDAMAIL